MFMSKDSDRVVTHLGDWVEFEIVFDLRSIISIFIQSLDKQWLE